MRLGAAVLCAALGAASLVAADEAGTPEAVLAEGIALVQQGDFEAAVLKLDEASRRLSADPSRRTSRPPAAGATRPLADAYLYLGISYLELNQELNARAKFREVLKVEPSRKLSDRVFSPQIIRVFETARVEMFPNEKKKRSVLPLLLIAGGGAASAGVAVATSGGDTPTTTFPATTSTTTPPVGGGGNSTPTTSTTVATDPGPNPTTTTTTTTTLPGVTTTTTLPSSTTTTLPGSTTTTLPGSTTTTSTTSTTSTTTTTTSTTTTTTMPVCTYSLQPDANFSLLGGTGTCSVVTQPGCQWTANTDVNWITLTGATSGAGNGAIPYSVAALTIGIRNGRVGIAQSGSARCAISQALLRAEEQRPGWESILDVDGGRGQMVIDGAAVRYQEQGASQGSIPTAAGTRQVVAVLVASRGRPGSWTFRLPGIARTGSVRPLAGDATTVTTDSITFRLAGKPGERVVFTFEAVP